MRISDWSSDVCSSDLMKAYDLLVQCEAGLASITGGPEAPGRVGVSVADICCGMNAHAAILQALYARAHSGEGAGIAVSLFDGLADRSEEHTSELQSLMRISYAVFCLKKKKINKSQKLAYQHQKS